MLKFNLRSLVRFLVDFSTHPTHSCWAIMTCHCCFANVDFLSLFKTFAFLPNVAFLSAFFNAFLTCFLTGSFKPTITFLNLWNLWPCKGLVKQSANMSSVGQPMLDVDFTFIMSIFCKETSNVDVFGPLTRTCFTILFQQHR